MQLEIPSADELTAQAFRFRKEDKYAAHPIEAALRYHRSQAEKSGAESHGGFDGLAPSGVNENQGAESTISMISALQHEHLLQAAH